MATGRKPNPLQNNAQLANYVETDSEGQKCLPEDSPARLGAMDHQARAMQLLNEDNPFQLSPNFEGDQ